MAAGMNLYKHGLCLSVFIVEVEMIFQHLLTHLKITTVIPLHVDINACSHEK